MATGSNQAPKPPQDIGTRDLPISYSTSTESVSIVAIFHASFHPTRGNILDWSLRASDGIYVPFLAHPPSDADWALCLDIQLDGVEFSSLPSGLHLVEQDVVYVCRSLMREPYAPCLPHSTVFLPTSYFSNDTHRGVCIFRRRQTSEHGQRGFRLSSLGILLAPSLRPRPWRHVSALRALAHEIYGSLDEDPRGFVGEPEGDDWEPARLFFDERMVRRTDLGGEGERYQWNEELDENCGVRLRFSSYASSKMQFFSVSRRGHVGACRCQPDAPTPTLPAHPWAFISHTVQARPRPPPHTYIYSATRRGCVHPLPGRGGHVLRGSDRR